MFVKLCLRYIYLLIKNNKMKVPKIFSLTIVISNTMLVIGLLSTADCHT